MTKESKGKVLVAMSGGIDSSVTAILLHEQGYEVIGVTMKTWDYASSGGSRKSTGCCSLDDINDARILAVEYGFHHIIIDIREEFGDYIIDNFVEEYTAGRTPNPCVLCNTHIKWDALLKRADQLGCDFIATGHYANVRFEDGRYIISKGKDEGKDQSYVLWGLSQEALARTKFPLGKFTKKEIREMAFSRGHKELAKKGESYEICFIPDNDYRGFLKRRIEGLEEKVKGGDFIDLNGNILGKHEGYPFFTVGQRKGLGVAMGEPMYVLRINPENNTVVLGQEKDLQKQHMKVKQSNLIKYNTLPQGKELLTKVRYKDKGTLSELSINPKGEIEVEFKALVKGIAPGQSAVFYEGNDLVGGGFISKS
ncbi:MAG: tRNA 2-thiouridine(34) synthase MnmA [Verrucomicrobia bacterium]|nr:tRNA 2-thiouridine(34) synthase MnmA [Verrucomicrobiota bacterium]